MKNGRQIRRLKLVAILFAAVLTFVVRLGNTSAAQDPTARMFEIFGMNAPPMSFEQTRRTILYYWWSGYDQALIATREGTIMRKKEEGPPRGSGS
jgi:hypothetical protein